MAKPIACEPSRSKATWAGPDFSGRDDWVTCLSRDEIQDLIRAMRGVEAAGKSWGSFGKQDFPLPAWKERLRWMEDELKDGLGFVVLRGFPVNDFSTDQIKAMYWGLASQMGTIPSQTARGTVVETITDLKPKNATDYNLRSYVTAKGQSPHCDFADVVCLLCVNRAKEGGDSTITSLAAIYNRVIAEHPEYLDVLTDGFHLDYRGEGPSGDADETSDFRVPVFSDHGGRVHGWFHKRLMTGGTTKHGPPLTDLQAAALEYVESVGTDPSVRFDMLLQPGDLQLLSNYKAMHYRTAFVDDDQFKRLMLRVWINFFEPEIVDPIISKWTRPGIPRRDWFKEGVSIPSLGINV